MSDKNNRKTIKLFELYDKLAEDAGLIIPRPDLEDAQFYYAGKKAELEEVNTELLKHQKAQRPDIKAYGTLKAKKDQLEKIFNYMTCFWNSQGRIHIC